MISIAEILAKDDAHRMDVRVAEWDAVITVVSMTAQERADIERRWSGAKASTDPAGFRVDILARSIKNQDGTPWGTPEQFKGLLAKNASAIETLFETACNVSGFTKKDVAELEKN